MKRNTLLKGITVSVALSALLTGCGSTATDGDNSNNNQNSDTTKAITLSGNAVDGYLQYATVCLDLNKDGYCQATEPSTQTDIDGKFTLEITPQIQKDENFESAMLLVYGGKDVDTGDDFKGKLLAPKDGNIVNITPITTLVAKAVQKELKANPKLTKEAIHKHIKSSRKRVAEALDLPEEDISKDPVALQKMGNDKLLQKALELQKAVEILLVADDGMGKASHERADEIYEALTDGLAAMDTSDKGIEKLLDRTFEQARNDEKVKKLIGGDQGLRLGDAAKEITKNIRAGFQAFNPQERKKDDFLETIAAISKGNINQVEVALEEGGDKGTIAGQITIGEGFFDNFNPQTQFIKNDLATIGILNPDENIIEKIKKFFQDDGEKIKPGILFVKHEKLIKAEDQELQEIGKKIQNFMEQKRIEHEKEEAQREDKIIKITTPADFFIPDEKGYEKITFNSDNTLSFQKYKVQEDGTFAVETEDQDEETRYVYTAGKWVEDTEDSETFIPQEDGALLLPKWHENAYMVQGPDIAGKNRKLPQYHTAVTMPEDAQMYFIKIEKQKDAFSLHDIVRNHHLQQQPAYTSFSDFIEGQCGTNWFEGDQNGGLAFAGEKKDTGYSCDGSARGGKLVYAHQDNTEGGTHVEGDAGSWEIRTLDGGIDVLIVKPYNMKRFIDHEGDLEYPIFAIKDGKLYRGDMEPKGLKRVIPAYNASAMQSITGAVTQNWETIQKEFASFEDFYNKNQD